MTCSVLLVEPWYGGSHKAWCDGFIAASTCEVRLASLPARNWRWRLQGGARALADAIVDDVAVHGPPDALVVSSLVNLAALLGLARSAIGAAPVAMYVHESQLLYPTSDGRAPDRAAVVADWLSLTAADGVWWNSAFHRDAVLAALPGFLGALPEPGPDHLAAVSERSAVLPVGVDTRELIGRARVEADEPRIVWNQRWDHDKDLAGWLRVMNELAAAGVPFRCSIAGEAASGPSPEIQRLLDGLGPRIDHVGPLGRSDYLDLLLASDVLVSTARHEFFGIAIVEAIAAGCLPLLPRALSYPELIPETAHDLVLYEGDPRPALRAVLADLESARTRLGDLRPAMARYDWTIVGPQYDAAIDRLCAVGS